MGNDTIALAEDVTSNVIIFSGGKDVIVTVGKSSIMFKNARDKTLNMTAKIFTKFILGNSTARLLLTKRPMKI